MVAFIGFISNLVVINNKTRGFPEGGYILFNGQGKRQNWKNEEVGVEKWCVTLICYLLLYAWIDEGFSFSLGDCVPLWFSFFLFSIFYVAVVFEILVLTLCSTKFFFTVYNSIPMLLDWKEEV